MTSTPEDLTLKLHFDEEGSGDPLLLLHGFGANSQSWQYIRPALSKDHRVLSSDLKGFGKSPKPRDCRYGLRDQRDLIIRIIKENDLRDLTLVGHSMGGGVALLTTLELHERGGGPRIKRLILIDSIAYQQSFPLFIRALRTPLIGELLVNILPKRFQVKVVLKQVFFDPRKISEELISSYASVLEERGARYALLKAARQIIPTDIEDLSARYGSIHSPALVIWGERDKIVPVKIGERLNNVLPRSSLVVIKNCGHAPQEEKPAETVEILQDFLKDSR